MTLSQRMINEVRISDERIDVDQLTMEILAETSKATWYKAHHDSIKDQLDELRAFLKTVRNMTASNIQRCLINVRTTLMIVKRLVKMQRKSFLHAMLCNNGLRKSVEDLEEGLNELKRTVSMLRGKEEWMEEYIDRLRNNDPTLKQLVFISAGLSEEYIMDLLSAVRPNTHVEMLELSGNNISSYLAGYIAPTIRANQSLQEIGLDGNIIDGIGVCEIAHALRSNSTIRKLNLCGNSFGAYGALQIARTLCVSKSLQEMDLSLNNIGDSGASGIAIAIGQNNTLVKLDLSGNGISDVGAAQIANALRENKSLQRLYLCSNVVGDEGASDIASALGFNESLRALTLRYNKIGNSGASDIAVALRSNKALRSMGLIGNEIDKVIVSQISSSLCRNCSRQDRERQYNAVKAQLMKVMRTHFLLRPN